MSEEDALQAYGEELRNLIAFVEESLGKVQGGEMPDLGDLDGKVSTLCQNIETAENEIAQQLQPLMGEMIGKLDELAQALSEYQSKMQEE